MQLELVTKDHPDYQRTCEVIAAVYQQRLEMRYDGFPTTMIVAYDENESLLGSIGITRGNEVSQLGIEQALGKINLSPDTVAELNRLNVTDRRYQTLPSQLVATVFTYAWRINIQEVFVTVHAGAKRLLHHMQIPLRVLSGVDISVYGVEGGDRYRKLRPQALQINVEQAARAVEHLLPPADWMRVDLRTVLFPLQK